MLFEMPLFPLNLVLFPGTPLQLHIFEERYKRMINLCIQQRRVFGVVLIDRGVESLGPLAETYPIGCSAQIVHVQRLDDGRMNIVALGRERFRIHSVDRTSQPYLLGMVQNIPLPGSDSANSQDQADGLREQVERYIKILAEAGGEQFSLQALPDDSAALAYVASALLQLSPAQKQQFLAADDLGGLLARLRSVYRRELPLIKAMVAAVEGEAMGGFSRN